MKKNILTSSMIILVSTILINSCKKENTPTPTTTTSNSTSTNAPIDTNVYYWTGNIDGTTVTYTEDLITFSLFNVAGGSINDSLNMQYFDFQDTLLTAWLNIIIQEPTGHIISSSDTALLASSILDVQSFNYSYNPNGQTTANYSVGVKIELNDFSGNGTQWRSDWGDQTGSTFNLISKNVINQAYYGYYNVYYGQDLHYITTLNFSCKLYDGLGGVKTITNGFMKTRSGAY